MAGSDTSAASDSDDETPPSLAKVDPTGWRGPGPASAEYRAKRKQISKSNPTGMKVGELRTMHCSACQQLVVDGTYEADRPCQNCLRECSHCGRLRLVTEYGYDKAHGHRKANCKECVSIQTRILKVRSMLFTRVGPDSMGCPTFGQTAYANSAFGACSSKKSCKLQFRIVTRSSRRSSQRRTRTGLRVVRAHGPRLRLRLRL